MMGFFSSGKRNTEEALISNFSFLCTKIAVLIRNWHLILQKCKIKAEVKEELLSFSVFKSLCIAQIPLLFLIFNPEWNIVLSIL